MTAKVFSSFDVAAAVLELKESITDSRVNNIYQLDSKTLLLRLHKTSQPPLLVLLEAGRRFHLTSYSMEKPTSPPAFCMALRKHLRNVWLRKIDQQEFERIVTFTFETKAGTLNLILELFGEGNIVLTKGTCEILQALFFRRMRDRNIVRGDVYAFPPSNAKNPFKIGREQLEEDLKKCDNMEVVRAIARCLGVGGLYAEEILLRAEVKKAKTCSELTNSEVGSIYEAIQSLLNNIAKARLEPQIVFNEDGSVIDVVPFQLKRYENCSVHHFPTFNKALDEFHLKTAVAEKSAIAAEEADDLRREAERLRRVVAEQEQALTESLSKAERGKHVGDLIYSHSAQIQKLLDKFANSTVKGENSTAASSETLARSEPKSEVTVERFDTRNFAIDLKVEASRFSISLRKSIFENAAEFYELGKKSKQKVAGILAALEESRHRLDEINRKINAVETAQTTLPREVEEELVKRRIKGKEWYEKFRWFISSDSYLVVAGKDAVSNEVLIKKYTGKEDLVFHADLAGAPFVVVKTQGKTPSEQTLREASEFAAAFSRAWREMLGTADVYWIKPEQLSKAGPSGEYVPHGAFAVAGKRNWSRGVPLRTAVGFVDDGTRHFIGGPVDAVKAKAKAYVTLIPGDRAGKELLHHVLHEFAVKLPREQREKVPKEAIESIREFVPYTMGRIVSSLRTELGD